jgi:ribosome maturation factor RimP
MNDEQFNRFREEGTKIRIVRDAMEQNDVVGIVVAWDDEYVLIRRPNRRVIKIKRGYPIQLASEPRRTME